MYMDPSLPLPELEVKQSRISSRRQQEQKYGGFPLSSFLSFFSCKDFELRELQPPLGIADFRR